MRRLYLLALVCLYAVSAYWQGGSPLTPQASSTGNLTAAGASCAVTNACVAVHLQSGVPSVAVTITGTWSATMVVEMSADNAVTWVSAGTAPTANGQTTYTLTAQTDFRVRCSAFTSGTVGVFINVSQPTIVNLGPITNIGGSGVPAGVIDASSSTYGAKWDAQQISTASITSGSAVVTSSQSIFKASDVGKVIYGFASCRTDLTPPAQTAILPRTTIITFTSATSVTVNTNATGTQATTGCVIWGTPDDAAFTLIDAAAVASTVCPMILLPAKSTIIEQGHFNTAAPLSCSNSAPGIGQPPGGYGEVIQGQGKGASVLFIAPTLGTTNSATCNGGAGTNDCFGGQLGQLFMDFSMNGGGNNASAFPVAKNIVELASYSAAVRFAFYNFGGNDPNLTFQLTGIGDVQLDYTDVVGGPQTITSAVGFFYLDHSDFQDTCNTTTNVMFTIQNGATVVSHGSLFAPGNCTTSANSKTLKNSGVFLSYGDLFFNDTNGSVRYILLSTEATGKSYLYGTVVSAVNGTATTGVPISAGASGAYIFMSGTLTRGVSADPTWSVAAGATLNDNGGNTIIGGTGTGIGGTLIADGHSLKGTCTGVATAASTLGLFGTGPNETLTTCTSTTIGSGVPMNGPRTVQTLVVTSTAVGVNASSGVVTVLKNGVATAITCTLGTTTACTDGTHIVAFADGDLISIQFTSQAADTLAGVKALIDWN